jgi:hypothetical protein
MSQDSSFKSVIFLDSRLVVNSPVLRVIDHHSHRTRYLLVDDFQFLDDWLLNAHSREAQGIYLTVNVLRWLRCLHENIVLCAQFSIEAKAIYLANMKIHTYSLAFLVATLIFSGNNAVVAAPGRGGGSASSGSHPAIENNNNEGNGKRPVDETRNRPPVSMQKSS